MVTEISKRRLVILFVEGLHEPMKCWIKAFDPPTLHEAIARSMELTASRGKFTSNAEASSSYSDSISESKKSENVDEKMKIATPLDRETINDLRKRKLCFYCKAPYDQNHNCPLKPKGPNRQMEWFYEGDDIADLTDQQAGFKDGSIRSIILVNAKSEKIK